MTRRIRVYIEPRDLWIGAYVARDAVYVCPLPTLVIRWRRRQTIRVIDRVELVAVDLAGHAQFRIVESHEECR